MCRAILCYSISFVSILVLCLGVTENLFPSLTDVLDNTDVLQSTSAKIVEDFLDVTHSNVSSAGQLQSPTVTNQFRA